MPSSDAQTLDPAARRLLLEVAWESIRHGLAVGAPLQPNPAAYPDVLRAPRAAFVTLHHHGALRGCIGHLEASQPLVLDVADNAFAAAFRDPRFGRLEPWELQNLELDCSVLTPAEPMVFEDEPDLLRQLRPGIDGLILEDGWARGTFLPAVWESLPEPRQFLNELKRKAGLPAHHWSKTLKVSRYRTESFGGRS
ncbi:AmmeMemoRadiSam system protein A [uncultured Lamprocystis sp.]|jgi:AmmeMemoRadiSam system protein A|uniref:AmmeMemoRadiSam system protein A n=1 Tax=uncultured Lamprocystis sp. TaxID=543132 RepID=UPI0025EFD5E7|nr:AmmeMemoRadiSam system protein A [uncultured Lamprocystis sp.]